MASSSGQENHFLNLPGTSETTTAAYGSFASPEISSTGTKKRQIRVDAPIEIEGRHDESASSSSRNSRNSRRWYGPRLMLENSGSVARDHLASERTFLAYVRTSLALASAGVALSQLFSVSKSLQDMPKKVEERLPRVARPLGAIMILIGILVLFIGIARYFRIQASLIEGKFPPATGLVLFVSALLAVFMSTIFGIIAGAVN